MREVNGKKLDARPRIIVGLPLWGLTRREAATMVRRLGDKTPEPPGGRAAERLRMFEQARRPDVPKDPASKRPTKRKMRPSKAEGDHEEQTRRKD
jgi:hypothetical protein